MSRLGSKKKMFLAINNLPPETQGLISYYRLNGDATDVVGSNNGVATSLSYATAVNGLGASFDGTDTPKLQMYSSDFSFTDGASDKPFSMSFFVKFNSVGDTWIMGKRLINSGSPAPEYQMFYYLGDLFFQLYGNDNATYIHRSFNLTPVASTWYHLTVTYDGNELASGINVYVNGVNDNGTTTTSGTYLGMTADSQPLEFGNPSWITIFNLNGIIDGIGIFNYELTPVEVLANYNLQLTQELA